MAAPSIALSDLHRAVHAVLEQFPGARVLQGTTSKIINGESVPFYLVGFAGTRIEVYANGDVVERSQS